jgi:hypothetical protein
MRIAAPKQDTVRFEHVDKGIAEALDGLDVTARRGPRV